MSNLVFPLTFNAAVGFPIKQTPRFNTISQMPASGRGRINIPTQIFPLWDFELDISYLSGNNEGVNTPWQQLVNFYIAALGAAEDWLFLHPYDNNIGSYTITGTLSSGNFTSFVREAVIQAVTGATSVVISVAPTQLTIGYFTGSPDNSHHWVGQSSGAVFIPSAVPTLASSQSIGTGDGTTSQFSMVRSLVTGGAQDLIQNFVHAPNIFVAGVLQTPVTNYTGPDQYGTITFTGGHIPSGGQNITWTGQFYYRCSFNDDKWADLQEDLHEVWSMNGLKFRSVLL